MPRPPTRSVALTSRTTARADRNRRPSRRRVGRDFRDAMRHGNTEYALAKLQDHAALAGLYEVRDIVPPKVKETWQYDAYAFADIIGEVGYALGIKASTLSRCKIKPQVRVPNSDEWDDTDDPRVHKVLRGLQPKVGRQGDLLAQACMHYEVAGDCYLYGDPKVNQFGQTFGYWWQFYSVSEFKIERKGLVDIMSWGYGAKGDRADPDGYAKRFHNPKAEYSERAISAVYRVLPLMRQLVLLEQLIDCIAKSSMSAGILFMPNDISFGPMNEWDDPGQPADGLDEFESELHEHTAGAVVENTSPARLNPLMVRAKGITDGHPTKDLIGIIDLSRDIDKYCVELRKELVGRIASGLDVPAELVTGKGTASHWNAWSIDDDFISQNVIPIGQRICDFLTAAYLRPFLVLTGMTEQESEWFRLELDATPVTSDVDQSANATTAYIAGQITAEAWIRYLGLDEEDMPTADEEIRRLYLDLLRVQPQNAPTLMRALFPEHDFGSTFDGWIAGGGTAGLPGGISDIPVPHDSGQPQRTSITYGLERMIAAAADRNLDAAIAQAARRLVGRLDGIDGDAAAGLRRVDVQDVLTVAGPTTAQRCGVGASDLFAGAFDGLGVQVTDWLSVDMASRGVDPYEARSRASIAADELKAQLTLHAGTSLQHRLSRTPNGTRIPAELVASAIAVGEMADTSAQ